MKTRQGKLADIDRILADIDRALFVLPAGGPVTPLGTWCWKDRASSVVLISGGPHLIPCGRVSGDNGLDLCPEHYEEFTA